MKFCFVYEEKLGWMLELKPDDFLAMIDYMQNNDSMIAYLNELQDLFKKMKIFFKYSKSNLKLVFPLAKTYKEHIMDDMPNNLMKYVVYCEEPIDNKNKFSNCKDCNPCKRAIAIGLNERIKHLNTPIKSHKNFLAKKIVKNKKYIKKQDT